MGQRSKRSEVEGVQTSEHGDRRILEEHVEAANG